MKKHSSNYLRILAVLAIVFSFAFYSERSSAYGGKSGYIPLKEAKLNIEHNATDLDTGFQGAVDSEGWRDLTFRGPGGKVLMLKGLGDLGKLGLTEVFFETVEPENSDVGVEEMLENLPEGNYTIEGQGIENGERTGKTKGVAWLTHNIPAGPVLVSPKESAVVPTNVDLVMDWEPVTKTIKGDAVTIIAYQLIVEKNTEPHSHMIGKLGSFSVYLPIGITSMRVPKEFLEPNMEYDWEVLAIEESGNQTLSSGKFSTK